MNRVTQRLEEWKRKIVDLSRRNRLLFFARTRGSTLRIVEPSLPEIFDRFVNLEKPWEFCMPPDAKTPVLEPAEPAGGPLGDAQLFPVENVPPRHAKIDLARNSDELVTDVEDGAKLRSMLRNLYRRSRTDFEERGVRILFLAFGLLEWKEVEQSEVVKSPILLVPAELRRESVNDPFQLCAVDRAASVSPARPCSSII